MEHADVMLVIQIMMVCTVCHINIGEANSEPRPLSSPLTGPNFEPHGNPVIIEGPKDEFFAKGDPAALYCSARGDPQPNIAWYYNREELVFDPVTKYNDNRRMIMADGQLFFLYFQRKSDVGAYYCKASNIHGSVTSREAIVDIAVIKDDFRQEPVNTTKALLATAILHCKPPTGKPEPEVIWLHNGKPLVTSERSQVQESGDLTISSVLAQDSGEYVCVAHNRAGKRRSSAVLLKVVAFPKVTLKPEDVSADVGETVLFHCEISGEADIKWRKEGDAINQQKWRILPDHSLQIENVAMADDGVYVCYGVNAAGTAEATAHLRIEYVPKLEIHPQNQTVVVGRTATVTCMATGNPPPTVYWETKSQMNLMFANQKADKCGRYCVTEDGTLHIEGVQKSDQGEYTCQALNSKGKVQATAVVTVAENDIHFPPIIMFGPQNQTLAQDSDALLGCQVAGNPPPLIQWYKNDVPISTSDARFTFLHSGTLQISSLKVTDSGQYMCKAISEAGETTVAATLNVQSSGSVSMVPLKTVPDHTLLPAAPDKPVVSDVTDTSIRLTWQLEQDTSPSAVHSYQVEYFGYGVSETWEIIRNQYTSTDVTIHGLVPNTTYVFLVRAKNSHGLGGPSPLSDHITTLEKRQGQNLKPFVSVPENQVDSKLKEVEVQLVKGEAVNSSTIKISWQVSNEQGIVDGFVIKYRLILNMGDRQNQRYGRTFNKSVPYRPLTQMIGGLESYEYYEICMMAASGHRTSPCSPPMKIQSGGSVPSSAPHNIEIHRESDKNILVTWSPPGIENRKGEIIGFQIKCFSEDGTHNCSRRTNGSTYSVTIDNLVPGLNYDIQIAAQTEKGVGKWSETYYIVPDQNAVTKEPWFIGMIGAFGGVVWLGLCVFAVWLCKNRKCRKNLKDKWYTRDPAGPDKNIDKNDSSLVQKDYGVKQIHYLDNNGELSTLLKQLKRDSCDDPSDPAYECSHPEMKTFNQQARPVVPYATTALLQAQAQNSRKQNAEQMFHPVTQSCAQQSDGSGGTHTDRSTTTDENSVIVKQQRKPGHHPRMCPSPAVINWNDVLPLPPSHSPTNGDYLQEDQLYSEIAEDRVRTCVSPSSACSCPVAYTQQVSAGHAAGGYSDYHNHCQSLRNFETRVYSPQQMLHVQRSQGIPAKFPRTLGSHSQRQVIQHGGGTPVLYHGYSQPWDSQHMSKAMYDYAQIPKEDGCNYSQPIQDSLIEHFNMCPNKDRNFQPLKGSPLGDYPATTVPYSGPYGYTPGGPAGNYCEDTCMSQGEVLNKTNTSYHKNISDNYSQLPYLDSYKIDSPPQSSAGGSDYQVCNSEGSSHSAGTGGSGQMKSCVKGRSSSNDTKDEQIQGIMNHSRTCLLHATSQTTSSHKLIDEEYSHNTGSPMLEDPDHEVQESDNDEDRNNERDSIVANWESMEDCSSVYSSLSNESLDNDGQFVNEDDFANAIARAAELSGLTVVCSAISEPSSKPVKRTRHHYQARPPSPGYSTDSNCGTADVPRKPYPKSERRKQLGEHSRLCKKPEKENIFKGDNLNITETTHGDSHVDVNNVGAIQHNNISVHPSSPKYPSFYRKKPTDSSNVQEVQKNPVLKAPIFQFSDEIPVL